MTPELQEAIRKIDINWPMIETEVGECYCYYCNHLLGRGPNGPFPHEDDCPITAIRNYMEPTEESKP